MATARSRTMSGIALASFIALSACSDPCANKEIARALSPDGEWLAVLFTRDCGATTSISTQVTLMKPDAGDTNGPGNVLTMTAGGNSPLAEWGGPWASLAWTQGDRGNPLAPRQLLVVILDAEARTFTRVEMIEGVQVIFEPRDYRPEDSQ
ncbi:MAG: hypothetical protein ACK5KM_08260 [Hyphomicrobiaceae bacterium]